ncbi:serine O-acetyltransferase [Photobacterium phosphoreum]|uniref:serine O-acetyltransferase n=1 Tax=Photobacterium phosphoreum TaxID=659 RepID=UPI0015E74BA9|nr:serine acetyltransferase [Photobacterium phosphoreum]
MSKKVVNNNPLIAKIFLSNFNLASRYYTNGLKGKIFVINVMILKVFKFFCGLDIPARAKIGKGLMMFHPQDIVIHRDVIIGDNVILKHNITIGNKVDKVTGKYVAPVIGNNVELSPGVIILGDVVIGDNCIIGAGSIVTKSIPKNSIAVGNPAKVIKIIDEK